MTITSPVILLLCLPLIGIVVWRARRITSGAIARWSTWIAAACLLLAAAGIELRCDRDAKIVVMIDVSPSTRTATFRDPNAVEKRLRPILRGRAYETIYFADGIQQSPQESPAARTRMEPPIADAVLLLSDGQFDPPVTMPPTFAVIDPALDAPPDAQVDDIEQRGSGLAVTTTVTGDPRTLRLSNASPNQLDVASGDRVTLVQPREREMVAGFARDERDAWPENDAMRYRLSPPRATESWAVGTPVTGFRAIAPDALPNDPADYLSPSAIVLDTRQSIDAAAADRMAQYVRDLGGMLILAGPASAVSEPLRSLAPLVARPPEPERPWVILVDASGSMDAKTSDGRSRWFSALVATRGALRHLPEEAKVSMALFNRSVQWIGRSESPGTIWSRTENLETFSPSGPTGLSAALDAIATDAAFANARLLVITDGDAAMGSADALAQRLSAARIQLLAILTTDGGNGKAVRDLASTTGGAAISESDAGRWAVAARSLVQQGLGDVPAPGNGTARGTGEISGLSIRHSLRWTAWPRTDAEVIAKTSDQHALVATCQAGAGRVVSVVAEVDPNDLAQIAQRLQQPPADPRFAVKWDERQDRVTLTARDRHGPMNGLQPTLARGGAIAAFDQTAPGEYGATIERRAEPTLATVNVGGQIVGRRAIAGRYAKEFDVTGNDRRALRTLTERTGGRLIQAGDNKAIDFPGATEWRSTRPVFSALSSLALLLAVVFLRAPYLEDRALHVLGLLKTALQKKSTDATPTPR